MVNAPERGHIIWMVFDPRVGHEQGGLRPALVISRSEYNEKSGMLLCFPITSKIKGYSTEVALPKLLQTTGVILASHVYTMDWRARGFTFIEAIPEETLVTAVQRLATVILP